MFVILFRFMYLPQITTLKAAVFFGQILAFLFLLLTSLYELEGNKFYDVEGFPAIKLSRGNPQYRPNKAMQNQI